MLREITVIKTTEQSATFTVDWPKGWSFEDVKEGLLNLDDKDLIPWVDSGSDLLIKKLVFEEKEHPLQPVLKLG